MNDERPKTRTLTLTQGTPEWAFVAACRALRTLQARGVTATVTLYGDGSGELRIPREEFANAERADFTPAECFDLVGSERIDLMEGEDFVIRQCGGFAWRELVDV